MKKIILLFLVFIFTMSFANAMVIAKTTNVYVEDEGIISEDDIILVENKISTIEKTYGVDVKLLIFKKDENTLKEKIMLYNRQNEPITDCIVIAITEDNYQINYLGSTKKLQKKIDLEISSAIFNESLNVKGKAIGLLSELEIALRINNTKNAKNKANIKKAFIESYELSSILATIGTVLVMIYLSRWHSNHFKKISVAYYLTSRVKTKGYFKPSDLVKMYDCTVYNLPSGIIANRSRRKKWNIINI
jgi:hypothetical protein